MPGAPRCSEEQQAILHARLAALALDFLQAQREIRRCRDQARREVERLAIEINAHQRNAQAALAAMQADCESAAARCGASQPHPEATVLHALIGLLADQCRDESALIVSAGSASIVAQWELGLRPAGRRAARASELRA
jgi:lipid II:glycine glycyltransferase (peptidoglycan interpeptide bridge formation enzyme)